MGFSEDCTNASGSSALTVEEAILNYGTAGSNLSGSDVARGKYFSGWGGMGSRTITIDNFPNIVMVIGSVACCNFAGLTCGYNVRVNRSGYGTIATGSQRNIARNDVGIVSVITYETDVPAGNYTYTVDGWQQYNGGMLGHGAIDVAVIYNA